MTRLLPTALCVALGAGCLATHYAAQPRGPRGRWTITGGATPGHGEPGPRGPGARPEPPRRAPGPGHGGARPVRPRAARSRAVPLPSDPLGGLATWYGRPFHGKRNASGEIYDMYGLTAAHRTLPFGTVVRVKNLRNQREVDVRITDRGPFGSGRVIDLSLGAARQLGMVKAGVVPVRLRVVRWGKNCRTFHGRTTCSPSRHFPRPPARDR